MDPVSNSGSGIGSRASHHAIRSLASAGMIGIAIGVVGALALSRFVEALLHGVTPLDPVVYAVCVDVVLAVTSLASVLPAPGAGRLAPAAVLRED